MARSCVTRIRIFAFPRDFVLHQHRQKQSVLDALWVGSGVLWPSTKTAMGIYLTNEAAPGAGGTHLCLLDIIRRNGDDAGCETACIVQCDAHPSFNQLDSLRTSHCHPSPGRSLIGRAQRLPPPSSNNRIRRSVAIIFPRDVIGRRSLGRCSCTLIRLLKSPWHVFVPSPYSRSAVS